MSLDALLDSRISVWRLDDGSVSTNRLGEPDKVPKILQAGIRASLDNPRLMSSRDSGAGDRMVGTSILTVQKKANIILNDIISIDSGANAGSWWVAIGFFRHPERGNHKEGLVTPYVGVLP